MKKKIISIDFSIHISGVLEFIYFSIHAIIYYHIFIFYACNYLSVFMHSLRSYVVFDQ